MMNRQKIRELGVKIGALPTGEKNCITDVRSVLVGHSTIKEKLAGTDYACTGVTAILPHEENIFQQKVIANSYTINGFGKTTGLVQVEELGQLESPIMLTNTFSVPAVAEGTLHYLLRENSDIGDTTGTVNIVVGECNDSYLNSIRQLNVTKEHAIQAIRNASQDRVEEGAVGGGTGMVCFGFKGGIGSSSRIVSSNEKCYTLGCLVQANFGKKEEFPYLRYGLKNLENNSTASKQPPGSIIIVIATDAPLDARQLKRIAKRASVGLSRVGSNIHNGSGDIVIAFSNAQTIPHNSSDVLETLTFLRDDSECMNLLFQAAAEATEEAILNALTKATTTKGRNGRKVEQLPCNFK